MRTSKRPAVQGLTRRQWLAAAGASALAGPLHALAGNGDGDIVALAAARHMPALYKAQTRALYRSNDGARSWEPVALPSLPRGARLSSASISAGERPALYIAGPRLSVWRSDAQVTGWTEAGQGLPSRDVIAVAAHATRPDTVYAYIAGRGILRSEDAGQHWHLMDAGPRGGLTRFVHSDMAGSMQSGWLYTAGPQGVRLSMDCFCGWRNGDTLPAPARAVTFDPHTPSRVVASAADGVHESTDGGQTWKPLPDPGMKVDALAFAADGTLFAAGSGTLLRHTADGWERLHA